MHDKTFAIKILIVTLLASCMIPIIIAGPVSDKDITFTFNISDEISDSASRISNVTLNEGEWRLYFISIGEFERDNWSFSDYYSTIKDKYLNIKRFCGADSSFFVTTYKMSDEEKLHKGCVINGTYQEEYCFKTITNISSCSALIPYKIDYDNRLNFESYYDSYMYDIKRADFYNHFEPAYCTIGNETGNHSCVFKIHKASVPYNPYIVVLEKLNSTDDIYFSDRINISEVQVFYDESLFNCSEPGCDVNINMTLELKRFEIKDHNILNIGFEDSNTSKSDDISLNNQTTQDITIRKTNFFQKFIDWIRSIF